MGEIMANSIEDVERKVAALSRLPSVEKVDSILAVLPPEQERKLALIRELRPLLAEMTMQRSDTEAVDLGALRTTLERLNAKIESGDEAPQTTADEGLPQALREAQQLIKRFLQRTQEIPAADIQSALSTFQQELRHDLADKLALLQRNMEAQPVTIEDLPSELRDRYVGKTGKFRLFVMPAENVWEPLPLARFVRDLQAVDTDAIGAPVTNYEYMETIKEGYSKASVYAMSGIVFLTFLMFRGALSTILALVPLLVGSVWTLGMMVLFGVQFNMANLLFLPLIIGIGIDNGVHIMHSYRTTGKYEGESVPLAKSTAKAHYPRGADDDRGLRQFDDFQPSRDIQPGLAGGVGGGECPRRFIDDAAMPAGHSGLSRWRAHDNSEVLAGNGHRLNVRASPYLIGNDQPLYKEPSEPKRLREETSMPQARKPLAGHLLLGAIALAVSIDLHYARPALGGDPRNVCRQPCRRSRPSLRIRPCRGPTQTRSASTGCDRSFSSPSIFGKWRANRWGPIGAS